MERKQMSSENQSLKKEKNKLIHEDKRLNDRHVLEITFNNKTFTWSFVLFS